MCAFAWASHHQDRRLQEQLHLRQQRSVELLSARGHAQRHAEAHANVRTEFAEHKRTEKDRVEKEARRLSAVYIRDHLELASASSSGDAMAAPDSPPAIPPLALRGRAPLPPSKAAGAWQAVLDGWHSLISPRARTQTGHSIKQVERRTSEQLTSLDEEGAQSDSASAPVPANPGAMSRARGIVKQASRTVCAATGKLSKVESTTLLADESQRQSEEEGGTPQVLPEDVEMSESVTVSVSASGGEPSAEVEGTDADAARPSSIEEQLNSSARKSRELPGPQVESSRLSLGV